MGRNYYNAIGLAMSMVDPDIAAGIIGAGLDGIADRVMQTNGKYVYLSSVDGDAGYDGLSWQIDDTNNYGPVTTLAAAVALCDEGDCIVVMPGHVETIIASTVVGIDGIAIVGVGRGDKMPQIKFNNAAAEISVTADNVLFHNIRFTADVTDVLVAIEIEDGVVGCEVKKCRFDVVTTATDEFAVSIRTNDASNKPVIEECYFNMGLGAAVSAISFTKDCDQPIVRNNVIEGDYSTANINGITTLSTNVLIEKNLLINGGTGALGTEPVIELLTGTTGVIRDNDCVCNLATMAAAIVADTCMRFRNYYNEDVDTGTGAVLGTASADD